MQMSRGHLRQPVQKLVASLQLVPQGQVGNRVLYRPHFQVCYILFQNDITHKPATPYNLSLWDKLAIESYIVLSDWISTEKSRRLPRRFAPRNDMQRLPDCRIPETATLPGGSSFFTQNPPAWGQTHPAPHPPHGRQPHGEHCRAAEQNHPFSRFCPRRQFQR